MASPLAKFALPVRSQDSSTEMAAIPFVAPLDDVAYGHVEQVSPLIRRVIANNPSKYSYRGTGTYIVGHGDVAVIDPGPAIDSHRAALVAALAGERVRAILVTHCHSDHSPLAAWLRTETGAPTYAFGPHGAIEAAADDESDDELDADDDQGVEAGSKESVDVDFVPDVAVVDGTVIDGPGWTLTAVHTPGHTSNHTCFALAEESALFSGDHVMGWSTTVVSPPDGDMSAYVHSLHKLLARPGDAIYWPTHGNPITDPLPFVEAYLAHRLEREAQVLAMVRDGLTLIPDIVAVLYANVDAGLHKAARRSVYAHLRKLVADGLVVAANGEPSLRSEFVPV
jgi:glyoxylase-like metal-dependent hydrolase (beta-lactamase superfamily II)